MAADLSCASPATDLGDSKIQPGQERSAIAENLQKDSRAIANEALKADNGPEMPPLTSQSIRLLETGSPNEIVRMFRMASPPTLLFLQDEYNRMHPGAPLRDHLAGRGLSAEEIQLVESRIKFAENYALKP